MSENASDAPNDGDQGIIQNVINLDETENVHKTDKNVFKPEETENVHKTDKNLFKPEETENVHKTDKNLFKPEETENVHKTDQNLFKPEETENVHKTDKNLFKPDETENVHKTDKNLFKSDETENVHKTDNKPPNDNEKIDNGRSMNVFSDVCCTLYHTFKIPPEDRDPWIRHIEVLSDGNILLADRYNRQLLLYDSNGIHLKHVKLSSGPWSLAVTNNNLAAVTLPDQKMVTFVTIDTLKMISKIQIHDDCRGIACINNKLIVNCVTNGLKVLTLNGKTLKVFPQFVGYMSLLQGPNESLLCSHFASDRVVCIDLKGKVIYDFNDQTLSGPCSFTRDRVHEYLYVVGHHGNNIHMYGDQGQTRRILLTKTEGIDRSWAIGYDSAEKRLYISTFGGKNISIWKIVKEA